MKYSKYQQLIKGKEKANVDFKIRCDAFLSKKVTPKAELAKDICAMANNGNVASYILIGVSDDGKSFESVSNTKLTNDNVQSFCKEAIFPPPRVKVHREHWVRVPSAHVGKDFAIIQIGPHARQAFRLARDFIAYQEKLCYRRNEVWIRRGATSDLATPEEIARLVKGRPSEEKIKPEHNVQYDRLPKDDQPDAVLKDFQECIEEIGGSLYGDRVIIPLRNLRYVWRVAILRNWVDKPTVRLYARSIWEYEHGVLFLVMGTVSKRAFPEYMEINFKEKWGYFSCFDLPNHFPNVLLGLDRFDYTLANIKKISLIALTLPKLTDTDTLRSSFFSLLQFLGFDQDSYNRIRLARDGINTNLRRWLKQGLLVNTNRYYVGGRPQKHELGEDEILVKRVKSELLMNMAQTVLDLSAGRLP